VWGCGYIHERRVVPIGGGGGGRFGDMNGDATDYEYSQQGRETHELHKETWKWGEGNG
jgi:hypothetical protein